MNPVVSGTEWEVWLEESLERWREAGLHRTLRPLEVETSVRVRCEGKELVLFSGNDYLGLSFHPKVRDAVIESLKVKGMGPRGSALVCGYTTDHRRLEERLAKLKGTESALLFPSGFSANLAILSALSDPDVEIFSDELNHASLIDGCRMAKGLGAETTIYPHCDLDALDHALSKSVRRKKLIVTDAVFSMDGDLAPLPGLVALKKEHGAWLMVDEAHGTLVFGSRGGGLCEQAGVSSEVEIQMGTLSKAFGSQGGFAATTERVRDWLLNRGRSFVFSTAIPVPSVAAALTAMEVRETEPEIPARLWRWVQQFAERLGRNADSPIIPVVIGGNEETLELSRTLLDAGFHVPGIRPPTVPKGTARLRIALSAAHTEAEINGLADFLLGALAKTGRSV